MGLRYEGFVSTYLDKEREELHTARDNKFYYGYTTMPLYRLDENTEGANEILTATLREVYKNIERVKEGKQVDVYLEWELDEGTKVYIPSSVKLQRVEITEIRD